MTPSPLLSHYCTYIYTTPAIYLPSPSRSCSCSCSSGNLLACFPPLFLRCPLAAALYCLPACLTYSTQLNYITHKLLTYSRPFYLPLPIPHRRAWPCQWPRLHLFYSPPSSLPPTATLLFACYLLSLTIRTSSTFLPYVPLSTTSCQIGCFNTTISTSLLPTHLRCS